MTYPGQRSSFFTVLMVAWALGLGTSSSAEVLEELGPGAFDAISEMRTWAPPRTLAWSEEDSLAVFREDGSLTVWDPSSGVPTWRRHLPLENTSGLATVSGIWGRGEGLAIGSGSQISIWQLADREVRHHWEGPAENPSAISSDPSGRLAALATSDGRVCYWEVSQPTQQVCRLVSQDQEIFGLAVDSEGRTIAAGTWNHVLIWDLETDAELHLREDLGIQRLAFSPEQRLLAIGTSSGKIHFWDLDNNRRLASLDAHEDAVLTMAYDRTGRFLATGSKDQTVRLWDVASKSHIATFAGHRSDVLTLAFDPGGRHLASAEADGGLRIWSLLTPGRSRLVLEPHALPAEAFAFGPREELWVLVPSRPSIHVWDFQRRAEQARLGFKPEVLQGDPITALAVDRGGHLIAVGTQAGTVAIWRASTFWELGEPKIIEKIHASKVEALAFDSEGRVLASGSLDRTIRLLDASAGTLLEPQLETEGSERNPRHHSGAVTALAFGPENRLLSGSRNRGIRLWDTASGAKLAETRADSAVLTLGFSEPEGSFRIVTESGLFSGSGTDLTLEATGSFLTKPSAALLSPDGSLLASVPKRNGIVEIRRASDLSGNPDGVLLGGARGTWVGCDPSGACQRNDDGSLLLVEDPEGNLGLVVPSNIEAATLVAEGLPEKVLLRDGSTERLSLTIRNMGATPAYGITLRPAKRVPLVIDTQAIPAMIAQGGAVEVPINLTWSSPLVNPTTEPFDLVLVVGALNVEEERLSPITIEAIAPRVELLSVELDRDEQALEVSLRSTGGAALGGVRLRYRLAGTSNSWMAFDGPGAIEPGTPTSFRANLPQGSTLSSGGLLTLELSTGRFPLHVWSFEHSLGGTSRWPMIFAALAALAVFLVYRLWKPTPQPPLDPLVAQLFREPKSLTSLPIQLVPRAERLLREQKRLETVLGLAGVQQPWLSSASSFAEAQDAETRYRLLTQRLGFDGSEEAENQEKNLWLLKFGPTFALNLGESLLFFPDHETPATDVLKYLEQRAETNQRVTVIFSPKPETQSALEKRTDTGNLWVAPSNEQVTALLLAETPLKTLAELISDHVPLTRIAPYQLRGGVNKADLFFGREQILASIADRAPTNYLLVGGRQVGKSSLLKAVKRQYESDPVVDCRYLVLSDRDLLRPLARELGLQKKRVEAYDISQVLREKEKGRFLILVDEADLFIKDEREKGFPILQRLRSLSEEGYAHFIFAGFWQLYEAAVRDYQSPLKNFGDTLTIGALEHDACRRLATEPMALMKVRYESDALVERLIRETGQRANLISIACSELIKGLNSSDRVIRDKDLDKALGHRRLTEALEGWSSLGGTSDTEDDRIDRILVYATVEQDQFSLREAFDHFDRLNKPIEPETLKRSLARLELAFVLKKDGDTYGYQVPLFRNWLLRQDPEELLRREVERWGEDGEEA